jgi:murein DD-endopeptidase MepM/ murein hydrolase activator NlpD
MIFSLTGCASSPKRDRSRSLDSVFSASAASAGSTSRVSESPPSRSTTSISSHVNLSWPLKQTRLSRGFNGSYSDPHDGIDIPAPTGAKIFSSESGKVIYSGRGFHGYGKMILIEHGDGIATLYAHCSRILVKTGQKVSKGKVIGLVGRTGHATAPHLHFEIRQDRRPIDPMEFFQ